MKVRLAIAAAGIVLVMNPSVLRGQDTNQSRIRISIEVNRPAKVTALDQHEFTEPEVRTLMKPLTDSGIDLHKALSKERCGVWAGTVIGAFPGCEQPNVIVGGIGWFQDVGSSPDVEIVILNRGVYDTGETIETNTTAVAIPLPNDAGTYVSVRPGKSIPVGANVVTMSLRVDDYEREIRGSGDTWRGAADDAARQILQWVELNRGKLLEKRQRQ